MKTAKIKNSEFENTIIKVLNSYDNLTVKFKIRIRLARKFEKVNKPSKFIRQRVENAKNRKCSETAIVESKINYKARNNLPSKRKIRVKRRFVGFFPSFLLLFSSLSRGVAKP